MDMLKLQEEIDDFVQLCYENGQQFTIEKCKVMTITHKRAPIVANYNIKSILIEIVEDMGIHMRGYGSDVQRNIFQFFS